MNRILALDASSKSTGYACYDDDNKLIYGVITIFSLTLNRNTMAKRIFVVFLL